MSKEEETLPSSEDKLRWFPTAKRISRFDSLRGFFSSRHPKRTRYCFRQTMRMRRPTDPMNQLISLWWSLRRRRRVEEWLTSHIAMIKLERWLDCHIAISWVLGLTFPDTSQSKNGTRAYLCSRLLHRTALNELRRTKIIVRLVAWTWEMCATSNHFPLTRNDSTWNRSTDHWHSNDSRSSLIDILLSQYQSSVLGFSQRWIERAS